MLPIFGTAREPRKNLKNFEDEKISLSEQKKARMRKGKANPSIMINRLHFCFMVAVVIVSSSNAMEGDEDLSTHMFNMNEQPPLDLLDPTVFDNALGGQGTTCIGASKSGLDGCLKLGEYAVKSSKAPIDQCIYCKKKNAVPLCLTCRISAKVRAKLKEGYKCQQGPTTNIQKFTSAGQCSSLGPATPSGPPPSSPPPPLPPPPLPPPPPPDAVGPSGEEEIESSVDEIKDVGLECPEAYVG